MSEVQKLTDDRIRELEARKRVKKIAEDKLVAYMQDQLTGFFEDFHIVRQVLERMDERQRDKWMRLHGRH